MKKFCIGVALCSAMGLAFAHNCPNEMKAIDAALAKSPQLSDADMARVRQLRAEGEAAHKAGRHDESMRLLGEAKRLLKL